MDAQAGMLAQLFERSMGLGLEWEVSDVWFEERDGASDELYVRVAHVRGRAAGCSECGRRCGTHDARERAWRHLDVWQYETIVHCAVPRADCPEHGVAAEMPQATQAVDRFHVTRLFSRATDGVRCRERRESEEERAMLAGTNYVWLKREPDLTERQLAKMRGLDPARSHWRASTP